MTYNDRVTIFDGVTCGICSEEITTRQMRHSDGTGTYHVICEFNAIRKRMGMPKFQDARKVKYYSGFEPLPSSVPVVTHTLGKKKRKVQVIKSDKLVPHYVKEPLTLT